MLLTDCIVFPFTGDNYLAYKHRKSFKALWVTGAHTCVSERVVKSLGLNPIKSVRTISSPNAPILAYLVYIELPNGQIIPSEASTLTNGPFGFDIVIGMDIISRGCMTVDNAGSKTKFSFITSRQEILPESYVRRNPRVITPIEGINGPIGFELKYEGYTSMLRFMAFVNSFNSFKKELVSGFIDTGSVTSILSCKFIKMLGLKPFTTRQFHDARGSFLSKMYYIKIQLPGGLLVPLIVSEERDNNRL